MRKLCTAIALLLTALLAVAGYIVQNKNAADANKMQHEVVQEAAEREKVELKAGKQLERILDQQQYFVAPLGFAIVRPCAALASPRPCIPPSCA
jgi:hypothetical protein